MIAAQNETSLNIDGVLAKLDQVSTPTTTAAGTSWKACCPVHDDSNPSLSVTEKTDGSVLVHCFAGCNQSDVRGALGLPLPFARGGWMPDDIDHLETYAYTDVDGELQFEVLRGLKDGQKQFRQRVPDPSARSGCGWSLKELTADQRALLFMAPAVAGAIGAGEEVYVVEGEKDALSALGHGVIATCNAGGAGKFTERHARQLSGADVVVVQDKDGPGRKHGSQVCRLLDGIASSVRLVEADAGNDLSDHLDAGHGFDDLVDVEPELASVTKLPAPQSLDEWTDSGISERLAATVGGRWCRVSGAGWYEWTERVWEPRSDEQFLEVARKFLKSEAIRAITSGDPSAGRVAQSLFDKRKIKDAAELARGQLIRDLADFDTDPNIAVVGNGVVNLRTGELMPHDSGRLVTKSAGVAYRPGAKHPDWDDVLGALPDDVSDWLQVRLGQALTGYVPDDDVLIVLRGGGENGKSTVLGAVLDAMGDYASVIPDKVLLGRPDDHSTEKMTLRGLRLAVQEETPDGRHLNIHQIKKILGAPRITARLVHANNVTFAPICAVVISTNYKLGVDEVDHGTWRRLAEVRFRFRYRKPHEALEGPDDRHGDPRLRDAVRKGKEQQEAVLAWLIEGARRWYDNDRIMPPPPTQVCDDTEAWRRRSDHWLAFAEDNLVIDSDGAIWVDDVQREMSQWLVGRGHNKWSMNTFRGRVEANPWLQQPGVHFSGRERRDPTALSRPDSAFPLPPPPRQGQYLVGVRFRTDADGDDDASAPAGPSSGSGGGLPNEPDRPMPVITDIDEDGR